MPFHILAYRNAAEVIQYGVKNNTTFLECTSKSPQASVKWILQKDNDRRKEVSNRDHMYWKYKTEKIPTVG